MNEKFRSVLGSIFVMGVTLLLMGTATQSYFSDTETSLNNSITAGIIDFGLSDADGGELQGAAIVMEDDIKPCQIRYFPFDIHVNPNSNPGPIYFHIDNVQTDGGLPPTDAELDADPTNQIHDIDEWITFSLAEVDAQPPTDGTLDADWITTHLMKTFIDHDDHMTLADLYCVWLKLGDFEPNTERWFVIDIHLQAETGNEYQGDVCTFDIEVMMTQQGAPAPTSGKILLENKDPTTWEPILGDGLWGVAYYEVGSLKLDVEAHGLAATSDYQIKITSPEEASWFPVDAATRVAMASALASGVYSTTTGTAPPAGFNLYERGYWDSAAPNLATEFATGDQGVYAFTKDGETPDTSTTNAAGDLDELKICTLPSGEYSFIKLTISEEFSPWTTILMEKEQPMFFTIP